MADELLVSGVVRMLAEHAFPHDPVRLRTLTHWAHGEKLHWIRIDPFEVSGRRIYRPRTS